MKYNFNNQPMKCIMTNSTCYKQTSQMNVKGILWHSTGANNPELRRYVQPSENDVNYKELMNVLGNNTYKNDWNHIYHEAGVNAWIGKLKDGTVTSIQTLPWNFKPWGCGSGVKGSCNNGWIQFEICEDSLKNQKYFDQVYREACELTAFLCTIYKIDPLATINYANQEIPTILCHADSYTYGLGSNHGDVLLWFKNFNKTMDQVRKDVAALMNGDDIQTEIIQNSQPVEEKEILKIGSKIQLKPSATYINNKKIPDWVLKSTLYIREFRTNGDILFSTQLTGPITGVIKPDQLIGKDDLNKNLTSYTVKITASILNIRSDASTDTPVVGTVKQNEVYTIIEEKNGWGKLKSGVGWISLNYTKKIK